MSEIFATIKKQLRENDVVLYMKGSKTMPRCGFSATVVQVLQNLGVDFKDVDILEDENIRQGIKDFANWPTIPQLYIKGEFIGGCDIVRQLYQTGELKHILENNNILV
jgi:monothiol glutaredoxin